MGGEKVLGNEKKEGRLLERRQIKFSMKFMIPFHRWKLSTGGLERKVPVNVF